MGLVDHDVAGLFDLIDGGRPTTDVVARAVLERIVDIQPKNARAWELLDNLDGFDAPMDELREAMEQTEHLAACGLWGQARRAADDVRRRYGSHPVARAWLAGVHLLWSS